ncbi:MAG: helix-turn-helix domain-containing protein, partial [Patescibacteria group bacterium]
MSIGYCVLVTQDAALTIMKTGANVFLTGEPGSGKTHTVSAYVRYLREHDIAPSVTASTGIAATHIGGMTVHSWSGIGIKRFLSEQDLDEMNMREQLVKRIVNAKVLVIDEISMLDGKALVMVDNVCRSLRRNEESFGGLQVILVGDFFQLPPVAKAGEEKPQFCFDSPAWADMNPLVCYLSEQHRHEDAAFLSTLGGIRRGLSVEEAFALFSKRRVQRGEHPVDIPELYTHNVDVDRKNAAALAKIESDGEIFYMTGKGKPGAIEALKRSCLSPDALELKVGASVMFTKNNFDGGYVNGTLGIVSDFDLDSGFPVIETKGGEKIIVAPMDWEVRDGDKLLASITQIPLRLAWAITVHKSQGMSLDAAVMDLSSAFEYGQGYVALSRVRRFSGLYILGMNHRALEVHPLVLAKDRSFHEQSEEAGEAFRNMPKDQLVTIHRNFVITIGGKLREKTDTEIRKKKDISRNTYDETLTLVKEGKTLDEIAELRARSESTVVLHLEKLAREGKLPPIDAEHIGGIERGAVLEIRSAIQKVGSEFLKPIFQELGERYTYEIIRLVRLEFESQGKHGENVTKTTTGGASGIKREKPANLGAKWGKDDEERLTKMFKSGMKTKDIAKALRRLPGGIRAR